MESNTKSTFRPLMQRSCAISYLPGPSMAVGSPAVAELARFHPHAAGAPRLTASRVTLSVNGRERTDTTSPHVAGFLLTSLRHTTLQISRVRLRGGVNIRSGYRRVGETASEPLMAQVAGATAALRKLMRLATTGFWPDRLPPAVPPRPAVACSVSGLSWRVIQHRHSVASSAAIKCNVRGSPLPTGAHRFLRFAQRRYDPGTRIN